MTIAQWKALRVGQVLIDHHRRDARRTILSISRVRGKPTQRGLTRTAMRLTSLKSPRGYCTVFESENTGPSRFDLASDPRHAVNRESMEHEAKEWRPFEPCRENVDATYRPTPAEPIATLAARTWAGIVEREIAAAHAHLDEKERRIDELGYGANKATPSDIVGLNVPHMRGRK